MNYCYLNQILNLSPDEVNTLLQECTMKYFDIKNREWCNEKRLGAIKIVGSGVNVDLEHLSLNHFDEYTNVVTSMAWMELEKYLHSDFDVHNIVQAAFLLDIAERNCIKISRVLMEKIARHRSPEPISFYGDRHKELGSADINNIIVQQLNFIAPCNAFVRA